MFLRSFLIFLWQEWHFYIKKWDIKKHADFPQNGGNRISEELKF